MSAFDLMSSIFTGRAEERLSLTEERQTIALAQAGNQEAAGKLLLAYAPALRAGVAWYYRAGASGTVDVDDARQAAVLALLEAIQDFDLSGKYERLAAVARERVHFAVSETIGDAQTVSIPERTRKRFFSILRTADGDVARAADLAPEHSMTRETFLAIADAVAATNGDEDFEGLTSDSSVTDFATVEQQIIAEFALSVVDAPERAVCRMAYGFTDYEPLPDAEIAHRLGASRSAVQRTRSTAINKMRARLLA